MADSITKLQEKVASLRTRMSNLREKTDSTAARMQRLAASAAGAYIFGKMEADAQAQSQTLATVAGIDPALTWGIGAALASDYVGGRWGELLGDAGVGIVAAYAYRSGSAASR